MSISVQIGLLFALATAVTSIVGFLLKYRGADESPAVTLRNPVRSSLALFRSRWYTIGIIVATASWGLHVAALSLAPISIVQSVIAGGLVLLTVIADRVFGYEVTRREWICVGLTALALQPLSGEEVRSYAREFFDGEDSREERSASATVFFRRLDAHQTKLEALARERGV